jgi:outer membrane protein insertion porin family
VLQHAYTEVALPVMDMRYFKLNYNNQWFYPFNGDWTFMTNLMLGYGNGYGGKELPFFKNFYAGGVGSVRGYQINSLGPRDSTDLPVGGTRMGTASMEMMTPMPGVKDKSVRLSGFIDSGIVAGYVANQGYLPGTAGMRYSAGIAVTWMSPMGPLKLSYARPLNAQPQDMLQAFQFTMGSMF